LVNQQTAATGLPPVGFVNPALYAIGLGTSYAACFHDITTGSNATSFSHGKYVAAVGYDLCTGWGTPAGQNLIDALSQPPPPGPSGVRHQTEAPPAPCGRHALFLFSNRRFASFCISVDLEWNEHHGRDQFGARTAQRAVVSSRPLLGAGDQLARVNQQLERHAH